MVNILAVDTSTEYCSVALSVDGRFEHCCERTPRQHNQRLFSMLREILPDGNLVAHRVDCLAWAHGPGSFTGLRIAASAVQGLAFAHGLPVAGISTLACLAQGQYRQGTLAEGQAALVLIDARINEIYWGLYGIRDGLAEALIPDGVGAPGALPLEEMSRHGPGLAFGDGLQQLDISLLDRLGITGTLPEVAPVAVDLLPLAQRAVDGGELQQAGDVQPVYLRNEIGWKKLAEQGRK